MSLNVEDMSHEILQIKAKEHAQVLLSRPPNAPGTTEHVQSTEREETDVQLVAHEVSQLSPTMPLLEPDRPNTKIVLYLLSRIPAFHRLTKLREQGWKSTQGDEHFDALRNRADNATPEVSTTFFNQMVRNGNELQSATSGFQITRRVSHSCPPNTILEFGTAPGGFLQVALKVNLYASATAFTLPEQNGGHPIRIDPTTVRARINLTNADITLFAADMGVTSISPSHPDAIEFFPNRQIPADSRFDLVICGAGVLRTHGRAEYRKLRETKRLAATQLALGLGHVREGGTMIMLLHKPENWEIVKLLHLFDKFSDIQLFKPQRTHGIRSSFYLVAKNVRSTEGLVLEAVEQWKKEWELATFGSDEEFQEMAHKDDDGVDGVLEEFGEKLGKMGRRVWKVQADALERQSWMK